MLQILLFVGAVVGLLSIVPLATWAATGSLAQTWHALQGYLICVGILAAFGLTGAALGALGALVS